MEKKGTKNESKTRKNVKKSTRVNMGQRRFKRRSTMFQHGQNAIQTPGQMGQTTGQRVRPRTDIISDITITPTCRMQARAGYGIRVWVGWSV